MSMKKPTFKDIPLFKLEKIHHAQVEAIKERERTGKTEGRKIAFKNPVQFKRDMENLVKDIFSKASANYKGEPEDLLGMHFFVGLLYSLPLEELKAQELEVQREIKRKKELERQRINAGAIERIVKDVARK